MLPQLCDRILWHFSPYTIDRLWQLVRARILPAKMIAFLQQLTAHSISHSISAFRERDLSLIWFTYLEQIQSKNKWPWDSSVCLQITALVLTFQFLNLSLGALHRNQIRFHQGTFSYPLLIACQENQEKSSPFIVQSQIILSCLSCTGSKELGAYFFFQTISKYVNVLYQQHLVVVICPT